MISLTGYLHPNYAISLSGFGEPLRLSKCGGYILKRQIMGYDDWDAMGCYPIFSCEESAAIKEDLMDLCAGTAKHCPVHSVSSRSPLRLVRQNK